MNSINAKKALFRLFLAANHNLTYPETPIFSDPLARRLLDESEREYYLSSALGSSKLFSPKDASMQKLYSALYSDPLSLCFSAYAEACFKTAVLTGAKQLLILPCGYETLSLRASSESLTGPINTFLLDTPEILWDKQLRAQRAGINYSDHTFFIPSNQKHSDPLIALERFKSFSKDAISFCILTDFGNFEHTLAKLSPLLKKGSSAVICLTSAPQSTENKRSLLLSDSSLTSAPLRNKPYSELTLTKALEAMDFLLYELLTPAKITNTYLSPFISAHSELSAGSIAFPPAYAYALIVKG